MKCAADKLGVELIHLDYEDQLKTVEGYDGFIPESRGLIRDIHQIISENKPDAIVTFGPDGFSNHIDHRLVGATVTQVFVSQFWENNPSLFYMGFPPLKLEEEERIFQNVYEKYLTV